MFENISQSYDKTDATWEIIIMLLVAFILGYLLRHFIAQARNASWKSEVDSLRSTKLKLQNQLEECQNKSSTQGIVASPKLDKPKTIEDLKKVEGIGPKVESVLNNAGIWSFEELANKTPEQLLVIIRKEWPSNKIIKPNTWPAQARLAQHGKWSELAELQEKLQGGVA